MLYMEEPRSFESLFQLQGGRGNVRPLMCSPPQPQPAPGLPARRPRGLPSCLSHALLVLPACFSCVQTSYHITLSPWFQIIDSSGKEGIILGSFLLLPAGLLSIDCSREGTWSRQRRLLPPCLLYNVLHTLACCQ